MEERDWRVLAVLHDEQSITRTAQALYISQPALTARLHQIEQDLGATIVLRTSKGVKFTPQGEYLAETAKSMLREFESVRERVRTMSDEVSGTLRIAASQFMTKYVLPELLKRFKDNYPAVEYNLLSTWSREIYGIVRRRDAHVGFVLDELEWDQGNILLFEDPLCVASTSEIQMADLPDLPRIEFGTNPGNKAKIERWWQARFSKPPHICMQVDILDTCHEMVRHGLGYAILPKIIVENDPDLHLEVMMDREERPLTRAAWMIYDNRASNIKLVERFIEFVRGIDVRALSSTSALQT